MVERGHSPETAALALASRRARRTRSGPRLGCGSCGRTGACAIRSRCWTPLAPAACGQVWRRLPSRPATSGGLLNASPAGAGLIGRAQEGPPCLHSIRAAEPRVGWLQRWRLSANRPRRGSLSFVVLKQAVREETQRRRGRGRVALAPFSLSDKPAYGQWRWSGGQRGAVATSLRASPVAPSRPRVSGAGLHGHVARERARRPEPVRLRSGDACRSALRALQRKLVTAHGLRGAQDDEVTVRAVAEHGLVVLRVVEGQHQVIGSPALRDRHDLGCAMFVP
jgi:hypothetical protein